MDTFFDQMSIESFIGRLEGADGGCSSLVRYELSFHLVIELVVRYELSFLLGEGTELKNLFQLIGLKG